MGYVVFDSQDFESGMEWTYFVPMTAIQEICVSPCEIITTTLNRHQRISNLKFFDSLDEAYKEVEKRKK